MDRKSAAAMSCVCVSNIPSRCKHASQNLNWETTSRASPLTVMTALVTPQQHPALSLPLWSSELLTGLAAQEWRP